MAYAPVFAELVDEPLSIPYLLNNCDTLGKSSSDDESIVSVEDVILELHHISQVLPWDPSSACFSAPKEFQSYPA